MDCIDKQILMELQKNAKQNTKEIRQSGFEYHSHLRTNQEIGTTSIIKSYVAYLTENHWKTDCRLLSVTLLKHQKGLIDLFKENIRSLPDVMECHHVSGNFDFLLKVVVEDISTFHQFINEKLSVVDGISTIHSSFVLESIKDSTVFNV